jgi:hypothetical protein
VIPERGIRRALFDGWTLIRMVNILAKALKLAQIFGKPGFVNMMLAVTDLLMGRKIDGILSRRTGFKHVLSVMTIPYEDQGGLEDARLRDCPAVFAYEDVETGRIRTTAFCSWQTVKDQACRKIQAHYGVQRALAQSSGRVRTADGSRVVTPLPVARHSD